MAFILICLSAFRLKMTVQNLLFKPFVEKRRLYSKMKLVLPNIGYLEIVCGVIISLLKKDQFKCLTSTAITSNSY